MSRKTLYRYRLTVIDGRPWKPLVIEFPTIDPLRTAIVDGRDRALYVPGSGIGRLVVDEVHL